MGRQGAAWELLYDCTWSALIGEVDILVRSPDTKLDSADPKAENRGAGLLLLAVNISASAAARLWVAGVNLVATPIIVRLLGPDSYGLVGFSVTVGLFLMFLDFCVSPVLARELAQLGPDQSHAEEARNLLRTLEWVSGAIALLLGGTILLAAPWIARNAIAGGSMGEATIVTSVRLIGCGIAAQWPGMLYSGGFVGLQRQDLLVAIRATGATITAIGGVLLIWLVAPSVEIYLAWTAATALIVSAASGMVLWRRMPKSEMPAKIDAGILRRLWRFAIGNLLIGLLGALLTQAPSLIIAKYCTLAQFAAYALSVTLAAQVTTILTQPITGALMPHFAQLIRRDDEAALAREYHRWTQVIAALILPVAATLIWFPRPLMQLWLGSDSPLVDPVSELLPWIAFGTLLNTLVTPPYILQIASGWTRLSVQKNIIAVAIAIPTILALAPRIGPIGAAYCWVAVNLGYYVLEVPVMHRRLLRREGLTWWLRDTLAPVTVVAIIYSLAAGVLQLTRPPLWGQFLLVGATAAFAWGALAIALPLFRSDLVAAGARLHSWCFRAKG